MYKAERKTFSVLVLLALEKKMQCLQDTTTVKSLNIRDTILQ